MGLHYNVLENSTDVDPLVHLVCSNSYGLVQRMNQGIPFMTSIESYLQQQTTERGRYAYQAGQPLKQWSEQLRSAIRARLGGFPADDAELQAVVLERIACGGYVRERVEITTYAGLRMPIYVLIPNELSNTNTPVPAMIACHGHGYGSREICGMEPDGSPRAAAPGLHKDFAVSLVQQRVRGCRTRIARIR